MGKMEQRIEQIEKFASQCYEDGGKYSAFIAGAIWADNNPDLSVLWHSASEIPKDGEWILIQYDDDRYDLLELGDTHADIFCAWCKRYGVIRWAYVDDLLPKGGEQ